MTRFIALFRPSLVAAGALFALGNALQLIPSGPFSQAALTPLFQVTALVTLLGVFGLLVALAQLHVRQADRSGALGLIALFVASAGTVLMSGVAWSQSFLDPAAAQVVPAFLDDIPPASLVVGFLGSLAWFGLGWAMYGIATLRAGVFARPPAVLILAGGVLAAVPVGVGGVGAVLLGLGLLCGGVPIHPLADSPTALERSPSPHTCCSPSRHWTKPSSA